MPKQLALGVALLTAAIAGFAGSASEQFAVQITLNGAGSNNGSCTGRTSSVSLQVSCTTNVISGVVPGSFMPGFRPARDALLPEYCRNELARDNQMARVTCRLSESGLLANGTDPDGEGWQIEDRLYTTNEADTPAEQQACLRDFVPRDALTALNLSRAKERPQWPEMLVSF
jgi:hypothetical protein